MYASSSNIPHELNASNACWAVSEGTYRWDSDWNISTMTRDGRFLFATESRFTKTRIGVYDMTRDLVRTAEIGCSEYLCRCPRPHMRVYGLAICEGFLLVADSISQSDVGETLKVFDVRKSASEWEQTVPSSCPQSFTGIMDVHVDGSTVCVLTGARIQLFSSLVAPDRSSLQLNPLRTVNLSRDDIGAGYSCNLHAPVGCPTTIFMKSMRHSLHIFQVCDAKTVDAPQITHIQLFSCGNIQTFALHNNLLYVIALTSSNDILVFDIQMLDANPTKRLNIWGAHGSESRSILVTDSWIICSNNASSSVTQKCELYVTEQQ